MSAAKPVIQTENLTKVYAGRTEWEMGLMKMPKRTRIAPVRALDNLHLTIHKGEIFGYLGPNGAGKTTTIRLLLDLIRPTQGRATVLGMDVNRQSVQLHGQMGFMPGELNLWRNLTAMQVIRYVGSVRGGLDMAYVNQLAERFQFDPSRKVRDYSSGNRRKLGLIVALMHRPELLVLDEPTNGLDPLMQQIFNQLMLEARDEGRTVFLSSHVLSEVQAICDRVGILRDGQLKAVESVERLTHVDFRWVQMRFREPVPSEWTARLNGASGVTDLKVEDRTLKLRLHGDFDPVLRAVSDGYVEDIRIEEPTLEEIFLTFYGNGMKVAHNNRVQEVVR